MFEPNKKFYLFSLCLFLMIFSISCVNKENIIHINPGVGITLNNDTFLLKNSSFNLVLDAFKLKDTFKLYQDSIFICYPITGQCFGVENFSKKIVCDSITFYFNGINADSLRLIKITIKENSNYVVFLKDTLVFKKRVHKLNDLLGTTDDEADISIDSLTYNYEVLGVSFKLNGTHQNLFSEVSVFKKIEYFGENGIFYAK